MTSVRELAVQDATWALHVSDAWGEPCMFACTGPRGLSRRMTEAAIEAYETRLHAPDESRDYNHERAL